jgi:hypothetical protein
MKEPERPYKEYSSYCDDFKYKKLISKKYIHSELFRERHKVLEEEFNINDEDDEVDIFEKVGEDGCKYSAEPWYDGEIFSLQDILNVIPKDIDPNQIVISSESGYDQFEYIITLNIKIPIDKKSWQLQFEANEKEYQEKLNLYYKEKAIYDEWKIREDIKSLENKLAQFKK